MTHTIHLIEPTLFDQTGHGYSYTKSLIQANKQFNLELWIDTRGEKLFQEMPCLKHLFFIRKFRQLQKIWLYAKLLKTQSIFYVCTTEFIDMIFIRFLSLFFTVKENQIFLHFHQFNQKPKKLKRLKKLSKMLSFICVIAPTEKLIEFFKSHGFQNTQVMPCPSFLPLIQKTPKKITFEKILYVGSARADKGFPLVVDLFLFLKAQPDLPFVIQTSPPNSKRYDNPTETALQKLKKHLPNTNIQLITKTPDQLAYQQLFEGAICLLLYDSKSYENKFSGVALDALYAGSPILTTPDTWIAKTVSRFNAGIVLTDLKLKNIQGALETMKENFKIFSQNAIEAQIILQKEHNPKNTLDFISARVSG